VDDSDTLSQSLQTENVRDHHVTSPTPIDRIAETAVESATITDSALNQVTECAAFRGEQAFNVVTGASEPRIAASYVRIIHNAIQHACDSFVFLDQQKALDKACVEQRETSDCRPGKRFNQCLAPVRLEIARGVRQKPLLGTSVAGDADWRNALFRCVAAPFAHNGAITYGLRGEGAGMESRIVAFFWPVFCQLPP
jgi:hypothetical protein